MALVGNGITWLLIDFPGYTTTGGNEQWAGKGRERQTAVGNCNNTVLRVINYIMIGYHA